MPGRVSVSQEAEKHKESGLMAVCKEAAGQKPEY